MVGGPQGFFLLLDSHTWAEMIQLQNCLEVYMQKLKKTRKTSIGCEFLVISNPSP